MGEIIKFTSKPKSDTYRHRRYIYMVTYVPAHRVWEWEFFLGDVRVHGLAPSSEQAQNAAKLHIDLSEGV